MTEYELFGVLFFGCLGATIIISGILSIIEEHKEKQKKKQYKRTQRKTKQINQYAEFIAFATTNYK